MKKKPPPHFLTALLWLGIVMVGVWTAHEATHKSHNRRVGAGTQILVAPPILKPEASVVEVPTTPAPISTAPVTEAPVEEAGQSVLAPLTVHPRGASKDHPLIAIVIDDVGLDMVDSERAANLPPAVTLSYIPYSTRLRSQTADAADNGHELMLHMPMEPLGHADPGPGALLSELPPDENRERFVTALASFTGFDGVNNHMGSRYTSNTADMQLVMDELKPRRLFFLDSRTSPQSVGAAMAQSNGVPTISRDVFLDDDMRPAAVRRQLEQTEAVARRKGYAVAIGHPHPATLDALEEWIPKAEARGMQFVPLHDLLKK